MNPESGASSASEPASTLAAPGFSLSDENRGPVTRETLAKWSAMYGKGGRQIRRWIQIGDQANDPCPLDEPAAMPTWWARRMKWRVPDAMLKAAQSVSSAVSESEKDSSPSSNSPPVAPGFTSIKLADFELGEGEAVAQQRRLVAALYSQLERAYLQGGGDVDLAQSKYNKAVESLRKFEKDDREDQRQRGLLIPRIAVQRDIEQATELLRQMRESMARRVLELVPGVPAELREPISGAIVRVREAEDRVFRRLDSLKSSADAVLDLAAA